MPEAQKIRSPAPDGPDAVIGTVIEGLYRIEALIASGGMARVYRGVHLRMGSKLAIKLMDPELSKDATMKTRCLAEARALTEIQSNHVVRAIDVGELPSGQLFLVMEHLHGEDLDKLLTREGPLPWPRAAGIALQICTGLASAHRRGIIHRDMKPQNCVRIEADDNPDENPDHIKVIDFGVARRDGAEQGPTQQGFLLGTPEYLAPEFALGAKANISTDIYALGVTLYKLLTGAVPFKGKDVLDTLRLHTQAELVLPSRAAPDLDIPHEADQIIKTALAKAPKDRFASIEAMGRALRSALGLNQSGLLIPPTPLASQAGASAPSLAPAHSPATPRPIMHSSSPAPEAASASGSAASAPTIAEPYPLDRRVLLLRATLLVSVSALFMLGTWAVSPAGADAPPPLKPSTHAPTAPSSVERPSSELAARVPELDALVPDAAPVEPTRSPEAAPHPPEAKDLAPVELDEVIEVPDGAPPIKEDNPRPATVVAEAGPPATGDSTKAASEPAGTPEPDFNYASARKFIGEQQAYLRKTCMNKGDKPLSRLEFRIDVQPKGRPKVQVFASSKAVRTCVRELLGFPFDSSPRGGAFKYTLTETSGALRELPPDPNFVQVPTP